MNEYEASFTEIFVENLGRYSSMRKQIRNRVDRVLQQPYHNTESLADVKTGKNLTGCRSARVDRNFRIIFVVCEECRKIVTSEYCFCDELSDQAILFLTVGPHDRAYEME